jgi:hypothetical protein
LRVDDQLCESFKVRWLMSLLTFYRKSLVSIGWLAKIILKRALKPHNY